MSEPTPSPLEKVQHILGQCRESRKLVLLIVAIGLLLDNMLLTSVGMCTLVSVFVWQVLGHKPHLDLVPIIPAFLYELHHTHDMVVLNESYQTSTPTPAQEWNRRVDQSMSENSQLLARLALSSLRKKPPFLNSQCEKEVTIFSSLNDTS